MSTDLKSGILSRYVIPYLTLLAALQAVALGDTWVVLLSSVETEGVASRIGGAGLISALFWLGAAWFKDVLPRSAKEIFVFWRLKNRMPAHRVFDTQRDNRIDWPKIRTAGGVPTLSPQEQNALWYGWYKAHRDDPSILQSHKSYLAFRDLAAVAILSAPAPWFTAAIADMSIGGRLALVALPIIAWLMAALAARTKASDMMYQVLALKSE